ncbi:Hypothetical protein R9X50_00147800 [Acrodontium crateriforme]|uniref:Thioester reductase (TE) domain-containing protein n=1 Tax=Acrodontium crateriforme TaxID=150365 RepID=A0AAQ3M0T9_9PEZI|nr:Hypothetical protein R9X50_00147800 [Acrodontium crateriforme]
MTKMKVILTGATGFIGTEILEQLIAHKYITHIYALTRKELDAKFSTHAKVTQLLHPDFSQYPESLLAQLKGYGVEGCIWSLGGKHADYKSKEEAEKVGISFPVQAAEIFAKYLATELDPLAPPNKQKFPFRFVFISAWGAEQDQFRALWLWNDSRKIKGAAEKGIFDVADNAELKAGKRCFQAIALRPGVVIAKGDGLGTVITEGVSMVAVPRIAVDRLAKQAVRQVLQGGNDPNKRILENHECLGDDWAQMNTLSM